MTPTQIQKACIALGGQRAAARAIGANERTVRRWCAGESSPKPIYIAALLAALGRASGKSSKS